jgi:Holliday junction resolvasome RuvABC endonuclease subunit
MNYILWIDPWIRRCGYAIVESNSHTIIDAGVLINEKKWSEAYHTYLINDNKIDDIKKQDRRMWLSRMYDTYHQLINIISPYKHQITIMGIEQFYFMTRTQQHAEFLYWLRGALVMYAITQWRSTYDIGPTEMKKYITWRWWAKKNSIHTMVMSLYQLDVQPKYADISDALGIAYVAKSMGKKL